MQPCRIEQLDGLRGFAALIVVVSHFSNHTGILGGFLGHGGGQIGVMLFFALSGFLMGHLYIELPATRDQIAQFVRNRVARIVPLYMLLVLASYAVVQSTGSAWPLYQIDQENLVQHLFFMKGADVFWTVAVEMQFYALFVVIWLIAAQYREALIFLLVFYISLFSLA